MRFYTLLFVKTIHRPVQRVTEVTFRMLTLSGALNNVSHDKEADTLIVCCQQPLVIRRFLALLNDVEGMRFAISREIFLYRCSALVSRSIVGNRRLLNVVRFPVLLYRFRFLVHFVPFCPSPRPALVDCVYLAVLSLHFGARRLASCAVRQFPQHRNVPVIDPRGLTVCSKAHRYLVNGIITVGHFCGFQVRVIVGVGRKFYDEHVRVITADAVVSGLTSDAFLVMVQRHSSAGHPNSCQ